MPKEKELKFTVPCLAGYADDELEQYVREHIREAVVGAGRTDVINEVKCFTEVAVMWLTDGFCERFERQRGGIPSDTRCCCVPCPIRNRVVEIFDRELTADVKRYISSLEKKIEIDFDGFDDGEPARDDFKDEDRYLALAYYVETFHSIPNKGRLVYDPTAIDVIADIVKGIAKKNGK